MHESFKRTHGHPPSLGCMVELAQVRAYELGASTLATR